jgi:hypothetical protein
MNKAGVTRFNFRVLFAGGWKVIPHRSPQWFSNVFVLGLVSLINSLTSGKMVRAAQASPDSVGFG